MNKNLDWYRIREIERIDSPCLVVYKDRIINNLSKMIDMTGSPERLMPHVKTHKMVEIIKLHLQKGIKNFKCATISEAEMVATVGGKDVLIALQPVGPKFQRIVNLIKAFPLTQFSVIIDNLQSLLLLHKCMLESETEAGVFIDLNVGMNRTGIVLGNEVRKIVEQGRNLKGINFQGIHAYDGHNILSDLKEREALCMRENEPVYELLEWAEKLYDKKLKVVAGGTPTFPIHARAGKAICSPGTTVLWDHASQVKLPDLTFENAAALVTRIISIPGNNLICLDLGHKAIAAETPLPRVKFLNHPDAIPVSQSEEHLVVKVPDDTVFQPGDVFYGIPWHICPTCALYQEAVVVENNNWTDTWKVTARNRYISV